MGDNRTMIFLPVKLPKENVVSGSLSLTRTSGRTAPTWPSSKAAEGACYLSLQTLIRAALKREVAAAWATLAAELAADATKDDIVMKSGRFCRNSNWSCPPFIYRQPSRI